MSGIKTLETMARKLIEENGIRKYKLSIVEELNESRVECTVVLGKQMNYKFTFGHSDYYGDSSEFLNIVERKYPLLRNINPFIYVVLHEIGHSLDNKTVFIEPKLGITKEQYRELPREKAADSFAERFVLEHPKKCMILSKLADKAIGEYWSELS